MNMGFIFLQLVLFYAHHSLDLCYAFDTKHLCIIFWHKKYLLLLNFHKCNGSNNTLRKNKNYTWPWHHNRSILNYNKGSKDTTMSMMDRIRPININKVLYGVAVVVCSIFIKKYHKEKPSRLLVIVWGNNNKKWHCYCHREKFRVAWYWNLRFENKYLSGKLQHGV